MSRTQQPRNDFLSDLLTLQQDGRGAISAPSNWLQEPLLEIRTDTDEIVNRLCNGMLRGDTQNHTGMWHFFIGSPGNGKSAATGKLCRKLKVVHKCRIVDAQDNDISEIPKTTIPYALSIYEGGNRYPSGRIIQDTSVVRNPYRKGADPAQDLIDTLTDVWKRGMSVVVCTNRGVLEKAYNYSDLARQKEPWFKIIKSIVEDKGNNIEGSEHEFSGDAGERRVFQRLRVSHCYLDKNSLLQGEGTEFLSLLSQATAGERWKICGTCPARKVCPFRQNQAWLTNEGSLSNVRQILARAEIMSGQVIVFREMLALISLVLAGCPSDYGAKHPCAWVQEKAETGDIFALAVRRIYMSLFASAGPVGLEESSALRRRQINALSDLSKSLPDKSDSAKAMSFVVNPRRRRPTTDVGIARLLGPKGYVVSLDPCLAALPTSFYEKWDVDSSDVPSDGAGGLSELEQKCISVWRDLENCLESASDCTVAHWALRRWSSNFLLHFGCLYEGKTAWAKQLDACKKLLDCLARERKSLEDSRHIRKINKRIAILLTELSKKDSSNTVSLSDSVLLSGDWVEDHVRPKVVPSGESGSLSLLVRFSQKAGNDEHAVLPTRMYLWLELRASGNLDPRCFPSELLQGALDARVRAVSHGGYAFAEDDIELTVQGSSPRVFQLTRYDGLVDVKEVVVP